jgi:Uma2 family endonuclease
MGMALSVPRYTIDDIERLPEDGNRYEVLDGMLIVTPSPSFGHQRVAMEIAFHLRRGIGDLGVVVAPGAMQRGANTQLQPDILVVPARYGRVEQWREIEAHWLAVEVLSRSSRVYDREFKRDAYLALGVAEIWLVDLRSQTVEVSRAAGTLEVVRDVIRWGVPGSELVVSIGVPELFPTLDHPVSGPRKE